MEIEEIVKDFMENMRDVYVGGVWVRILQNGKFISVQMWSIIWDIFF